MSKVKFGRKWIIRTKEEYDSAMAELDGNEFIAEMSDDFSYWRSEKDEVVRQRADVIAQARANGLID